MGLVLPKYGDALSLLKPQRKDGDPPPRKTARLDTTASGSVYSSASASSLPGAVKKLIILSGPVSMEPPASYTRTLYSQLSNCIRVTLPTEMSGTQSMSITDAYNASRKLVRTLDMGENLYETLSQQLEKYLLKVLDKLNVNNKDQVEWLDLLASEWRSFENRMKTLQCMLSDVDQVYVASRPNLSNIHDLGIQNFKRVIMNISITDKIKAAITEWLNQERLNSRTEHAHRQSVITLRKCLVTLHLYSICLEEPYLTSTTTFWTDEGAVQRNAQEFSAAQYIAKCIEDIEVEQDRARAVLLPGGWEPVGKVAEEALLAGHTAALAAKALPELLASQDKPALKAMCELYRHVGALADLRIAFKGILQDNVHRIVMAGAAAPTNKKARTSKARRRNSAEEVHPDEKIVPELVALRAFAKDVVQECFGEVTRGQFAGALDDAFSAGVRMRDYVPSAMMAQALDREMRRGQRGETEQGWKSKLFSILELSRYTRDKDVFREIYTRALAKRLLTKATTDDDMEKTLIERLKTDFDPEFSAGDVMFRDLRQSSGDMDDYRRRIEGFEDESDLSLNVMVLTHAKWPSFRENNMLAPDETSTPKKRRNVQTSASSRVDLPPDMAMALSRFEKYYKSKHEQRHIVWFHSLGTVVLSSHFPGGDKEISVSMYQALVLLMFNEREQYSAAEIQARTHLSDEDLEITLQSLALGKKRVLVRANSKTAKEIALDDEFKWNSEFKDTKRNIRIQSIQQQTTMEETQEAEKDIMDGRHHLIDLAVVRIMKAKKTLTYEQIKTQTIIALEKHFHPTVADIKKRIDDLQEKEYISRDEKDRNVIHYVA